MQDDNFNPCGIKSREVLFLSSLNDVIRRIAAPHKRMNLRLWQSTFMVILIMATYKQRDKDHG